uniref:GP-PDE domain-containing protein n=1 Tax=Toxocara canis TaxID=6265 RepID=A0A183VG11_TOXCA
LWLLNRQETRRRRSLWSDRRRRAVHGLARDCGHSCFFRLRQNAKSDLRIQLVRWMQLPKPRNKSLPVLENSRLRPIVQYVESNDAMLARVSRFAPDCLYSAHVESAEESSIVNLCDSHGGLIALSSVFMTDLDTMVRCCDEAEKTGIRSGPVCQEEVFSRSDFMLT